ncbi:MAG TPA: aminopeptidase P N-terminal domain-containing protein [Candidatus Eisenbacteria bacterium]|nr:aminopeptidase P N-terminal domain-containing protein [Candidatus Eisenbacteria bacterium]
MKPKHVWLLAFLMMLGLCRQSLGADIRELQARRQHAAHLFSDGVLLLHAKTERELTADGYREEAAFYYLTGLENAPGTILAIAGKRGETWLFVPPEEKKADAMRTPAAELPSVGIDHVADWKDLQSFLAAQGKVGAKFYYQPDVAMLPRNLSALGDNRAPGWIQELKRNFPLAEFQPVRVKLNTLLTVESPAEQAVSREAARATAAAFMAGMLAIHPGVSQRHVELAVVDACWREARGVSFWPWAMAGIHGVFPRPFESLTRYDHLNSTMQAGDLVRLDVGCEWQHYQGDFGRTVPVSGHFSQEQREVWNTFVAAYQAVARELKVGLTEDRAFDIWKAELLRHREAVKSALAQQAIATWSEPKNVPYWQMHTMNLDAGYIEGPLRAGMVIDFEPIASIGGQGYYLEDMFLIGSANAEVLTPGLPYTAEEIEAAMSRPR